MQIAKWYPSRLNELTAIAIHRKTKAVALQTPTAVLFVTSDPNLLDQTYEVDYQLEVGIHTVRVYYKANDLADNALGKAIKLRRLIKSTFLGYEKVKQTLGMPDIVDLNVLARADFLANYLWKREKIPYVITERWSGFLPQVNAYKGRFQKWITQRNVRQAQNVITVSEFLQKNLEAHGLHNKYVNIPNVVDIPEQLPPTPTSDKILIANISIINDSIKNIRLIIDSVDALKVDCPNIELHLVGEGPDKEMLANYCQTKGLLNEWVFFHGYKNNAWVHDFLNRIHFVVVASNFETFSIVPIEAMAHGKPVLVTACGGPSEYMLPELGRLVPLNDPLTFQASLRWMIDHHSQFNPLRLHNYVKDHFSYEVIGKEFLKVYQGVLSS